MSDFWQYVFAIGWLYFAYCFVLYPLCSLETERGYWWKVFDAHQGLFFWFLLIAFLVLSCYSVAVLLGGPVAFG